MVNLNELREALRNAGVRTSVEQFQAYLQANKIRGGMKMLRASSVDHEGLVCPLHAGRVLVSPADPEAQPVDPVIPPNKQGFDVDCMSCFISAGNTLDHIVQKGLVV